MINPIDDNSVCVDGNHLLLKYKIFEGSFPRESIALKLVIDSMAAD